MRPIPFLAASFHRRPLRTALAALLILFGLNIARYAVWPPMGGLAESNPETTALMEYRRNEWRANGLEKALRHAWVPLSRISPHLAKAVVVAEDSTFWDHAGFDFDGMRDALERNIAEGRLAAGGSTITQQLAKNLYFSPGKSLVRKAQEAIVTKRLEMRLSKKRILELYLNCVEWGDATFGAEAAARRHFGVSAASLTAGQAATLAAMLPAPLQRNPDSRIVRKIAATILARMRVE